MNNLSISSAFNLQPRKMTRTRAYLISLNLLMTPQLTSRDYGRSDTDRHVTYTVQGYTLCCKELIL